MRLTHREIPCQVEASIALDTIFPLVVVVGTQLEPSGMLDKHSLSHTPSPLLDLFRVVDGISLCSQG